MSTEPLERKLTAILYADVAGYSRLTGEDEEGTHRRLSAYLDAITASIERHNGSVLHFAGDAVLADFATASDALACATAMQHDLKHRNQDLPDERKVQFRVGINLGEVIVDRNEIYGDGVNVAARLESLAESGGICISESVYTAVGNKLPLDYEFIGEQEVKNIAKPVRAYSATLKPGAVLPAPSVRPKTRRPIHQVMAATTSAVVLVIGAGVIAWWQPWRTSEEPASMERMAFPLPDKPSIAVLPFDNLSGDQEQEYFSDGITNDIITDLSKFKRLFVIASKSVFSYKGKAVKVQQVSQELGVRYVLEGSFQRTGERLRINAQLIDATTGGHLWAERYERNADDFFAIQEDIVRTIAATLALQIKEAELKRDFGKGTDNLKAYDYYQRGHQAWRGWTKEANKQARELFEKAIELDPDYARAYGFLTWVHVNDWRYRWGEDPERSRDLILETALKAVALDPEDYDSHWALGQAYRSHGELDRALIEYERAVALNPNDADLLVEMAEILVHIGRAEQAVAQAKTAMRINPRHADWYFWNLGWAQYFTEQYDEALATLKKMSNPPNGVRRTLAPVLVRLGRLEEARAVMAKFIETDLDLTLEELKGRPWKHREYLDRYIGDLRTAGLPEKRPLPLPDKPSIAVLPFANMSDDPKQEYFVDGMTDDLITDLSKLSGLFVIARNSVFIYKGKPVKVRQVAEELGVRYVLEGSVRRADNQVRINAQLIDTTTGRHVWAERYDGTLANVFAMQDEVTQKIVTALTVNLTTEEKAARARIETKNPKAYDAFLRGRTHYDIYSKDDFAKAISYLEKATQLDPNYARAHAVLAAVYWKVGDNEWAPAMGMSYDDSLEKMEHHLKEALKNPTPLAHHIASRLLTSQGKSDEAIAEAKRAVALDPNDTTGYTALARIYNKTGRSAEALEAIKKASRLDPQGDVRGAFSYRIGESYFHLDRFEESAAEFEKYTRLFPGDEWGILYLVAAYGHLGRKQEARSTLERFNQARAKKGRRHYTLAAMDAWAFPDETIRERYRDGLRKADLPLGSQRPPLAFRGVMKAPIDIEGAITIDATQAKAFMDRGVAFVDVRSDPPWKRGHIPGAVHLHKDHDFTEAKLSKVVAKDEEVVIYACGAGCGVTTRAVATAVSLGFKKIYFLRKGFRSWKAAGYPVEAPSG